MQSDTVIGIVGAVVLVAVMVGVFAYEYNNAPDTDIDDGPDLSTDAGKMAFFNDTYAGLDAREDLDGDGTANYLDEDIDGDGTLNAADNTTCVCDQTFTGSVGATSGADAPENNENTFFLGRGHKGGELTVTWSVTTNPVTNAPVDDLSVSISGIPCTKAAGGDGQIATCDLNGAEPGDYTVVVTHSNPAALQAKSFSGAYSIFY